MKNPFKKNTPDPSPGTQPAENASPEEIDINKVRDNVFLALGTRVGTDTAAMLRQDFDEHIAEDPVNGVELAYVCLCGKLVDVVDKFNDVLNGVPFGGPSQYNNGGGDGPISPFTMFRKDA